jgi:hypothetical protein
MGSCCTKASPEKDQVDVPVEPKVPFETVENPVSPPPPPPPPSPVTEHAGHTPRPPTDQRDVMDRPRLNAVESDSSSDGDPWAVVK